MNPFSPDPPSKKRKTSLRLTGQADRMFLTKKNYHQRGAPNMTQGLLPFKYEEEKNESGMTALAGLPIY
ncbi:MAG: hypothetical protein R6V41_06815, partial [Desulfobacteraceae bacterium]